MPPTSLPEPFDPPAPEKSAFTSCESGSAPVTFSLNVPPAVSTVSVTFGPPPLLRKTYFEPPLRGSRLMP